jgi:hypothetical protein
MFRVVVDAQETGLTGLTGFSPTPCEKQATPPSCIEALQTNPLNPSNPENQYGGEHKDPMADFW